MSLESEVVRAFRGHVCRVSESENAVFAYFVDPTDNQEYDVTLVLDKLGFPVQSNDLLLYSIIRDSDGKYADKVEVLPPVKLTDRDIDEIEALFPLNI